LFNNELQKNSSFFPLRNDNFHENIAAMRHLVPIQDTQTAMANIPQFQYHYLKCAYSRF